MKMMASPLLPSLLYSLPAHLAPVVPFSMSDSGAVTIKDDVKDVVIHPDLPINVIAVGKAR